MTDGELWQPIYLQNRLPELIYDEFVGNTIRHEHYFLSLGGDCSGLFDVPDELFFLCELLTVATTSPSGFSLESKVSHLLLLVAIGIILLLRIMFKRTRF